MTGRREEQRQLRLHYEESAIPFFTVDTIGFGIEVCGDHNPLTGETGRQTR